MQKMYLPILKGKQGELFALQQLSNSAKESITPMIEFMDFQSPYLTPAALQKRKKALPSFDSHIRKTVDAIMVSCQGFSKVYIDLHYIPFNKLVTKQFNYIQFIFTQLAIVNINAVPVICQNDKDEFLEIISKEDLIFGNGIAMRLGMEDAIDDEYLMEVQEYFLLAENKIDIILDFKSIISMNSDSLARTAKNFINKVLYNLHEWRSISISSGAFPKDLSQFEADTEVYVERKDWILWNRIIDSGVKRIPDFSDYSIAHPELSIQSGIPNASASIRYCSEDNWLIMRGRGTKTTGWEPIRDKCKDLMTFSDYDGPLFSWGDQYIEDCANGVTGVGGAPMWRKVANNRHMEKCADQIPAMLLAISA